MKAVTLESLRREFEAIWRERTEWIYDHYRVPDAGHDWPVAPEPDEVLAGYLFWFGAEDQHFLWNKKLYEAASKLSDRLHYLRQGS